MLTPDENKFIEYWERERSTQKSFFQQFRFFLPIALISAVAILLNVFTGWYSRATMVANSQSTPLILLIAIVIVAVFCSMFYKHHRNDLNEQRYTELVMKQKKESAAGSANELSETV